MDAEMNYVIKFPHVYVGFRVRTTWITFSALPPPELLSFGTKPRLAITSGKQAIHTIIRRTLKYLELGSCKL